MFYYAISGANRMSLTKQAKVLSDAQQRAVIGFIQTHPAADRNLVMFLLSVDAGLRAKEIAELQWLMLLDAEGGLNDEIRLENSAAKGKRGGGVIPVSRRLRDALLALHGQSKGADYVITSQRQNRMSAASVTQWFFHLYKRLGFKGCSSHCGRRTAITKWARNISSVGGSMRDVQQLARHSSLAMTQRYIEVNADAMRRVVG